MPTAGLLLLVATQVLFVGDSITFGQGADPGLGYVDLYAQRNPGFQVVNAGCPGSTSEDWVNPPAPAFPDLCAIGGAFELVAAEHADADVVHILLGTNDATGFFQGSPVDFLDFGSNMVALADRFSGRVFVSIPPPFPDPAAAAQDRLNAYRAVILANAGLADAPFELGADLSQMPRSLLEAGGGVHPSNAGHAWIADQLEPFLVPEPATLPLICAGLAALAARRPRAVGRARVR